VLSREFFARPAQEVAPELLGHVLEHQTPDGLVAVMLTEVEAYAGAQDPASHAYRGQTARNGVMFGPPGHAYVYFTYGMHFCVNLVCMPAGVASAVLLRAGAVIAGTELARARRLQPVQRRQPDPRRQPARGTPQGRPPPAQAERDLARGPARLCQALGIDRSLDGADVCDPASPLRLRAVAAVAPPRVAGEPSSGPPADVAGTPLGTDPRTGALSAAASVIRTGPRVGVREGAEVPWRFWLDGEPTVSVYRAHVPRRR
jgi:DNA-3-methyladenine glycosylase